MRLTKMSMFLSLVLALMVIGPVTMGRHAGRSPG